MIFFVPIIQSTNFKCISLNKYNFLTFYSCLLFYYFGYICKYSIYIYNLFCFVLGLWNHVFLFSNLSLFVFLPFAYLFSESSGFPGCRGLRGRVYETILVLALLGVAMLVLAYFISAWIEGDRSSIEAMLSE